MSAFLLAYLTLGLCSLAWSIKKGSLEGLSAPILLLAVTCEVTFWWVRLVYWITVALNRMPDWILGKIDR